MSTPTDSPAPPAEKKASYKDTLNLPRTDFAMEAKLVQNEPKRLEKWKAADLYRKILDSRRGAEKWVLHDGPPFANGDIHIGHVINKTLKDVFIRFKSMSGFCAPYVPGWDCHGLPIEHKIQEELGSRIREMDIAQVREHCFAYAKKFVGVQSEQFQRLGILGDWENPYLTMAPAYEASTLEVFARFVEAGLVYKKLKPVPWSVSNQTALADAELEYKDVQDTSVYVEFPAANGDALRRVFGITTGDVGRIAFIVWTTTPWTLPANLAIALHPEVEYSLVSYRKGGNDALGIVAKDLASAAFAGREGVEFLSVLASVAGGALIEAQSTYHHPFLERTGRLVAAEYVTTTDGTGLVHTAPGHGEDDYDTGMREQLDVYSPVLANGRFDATVPEWLQGKTVWEANPLIIEHLRAKNFLLAETKITHSYPHDWRSKKPIIFRATEQWFVGVDIPFSPPGEGPQKTLRQRAVDAVANDVSFVPQWGAHRLRGMVESRPDWCVSRQRAWGLPIPVFYNAAGEALLTPESVRAVARRFSEKGSATWFTDSPADLLAGFDPGPKFPVVELRKERDIFDVWFESGSSWNGVLLAREPELTFPADLYLEGSDQHRGWFQLSLLPSLGATGRAPFKKVLTHGFIVKPDGRKVSKSDKEYVTATQEIDRHGADLLRLWCCSVDYEGDIPTSPQIIREFGDKYRKVRNTLRYLMSNLFDFDAEHAVAEIPARSLDGWFSAQLDELIDAVTHAYERFETHNAFRLLYEFCNVQISAIYGNAMKDRLYCESPNSQLRRRCQTVMQRAAIALTKLLAPMLVFTADEAWEAIVAKPVDEADLASVHLARLPRRAATAPSDNQRAEWKLLMDLRDQATQQLDALKKSAGLNKATDAEIVYRVDDDVTRRWLQEYGSDLEDLAGCGHWRFDEKAAEGPAVVVEVRDVREQYKACARSWKRRPDVGEDADFPDLTLRDAHAVKKIRGA